MRDYKSRLTPVASIPMLLRAANATVNGTGVDTTGYESATIEFVYGTRVDGTNACSLEDSPDNSAWTAVAAADTVNGVASQTVAVSNLIKTIGYIGARKWVRAVMTQSAATTGATFGASVILSRYRHQPVP
jgi:hypothetical protein